VVQTDCPAAGAGGTVTVTVGFLGGLVSLVVTNGEGLGQVVVVGSGAVVVNGTVTETLSGGIVTTVTVGTSIGSMGGVSGAKVTATGVYTGPQSNPATALQASLTMLKAPVGLGFVAFLLSTL
jgi:hypothetical protein